MQMARLMSAVLKNAKTEKNREKQNLRFAYTQTSFVVGNCVEYNQQKIVSEYEPGVEKKNRDGLCSMLVTHSKLK